ncbi:MAG: hypothetical protein DMG79_11025 [Acidobacteria bacterium]|nr:MAG: hypothetical protein DMG79_11025 [Acidobacteriota bacterium]
MGYRADSFWGTSCGSSQVLLGFFFDAAGAQLNRAALRRRILRFFEPHSLPQFGNKNIASLASPPIGVRFCEASAVGLVIVLIFGSYFIAS